MDYTIHYGDCIPHMAEMPRASVDLAANLYGSSNGWAGTTGTLATMIWELLQEVKRLRKEQ